MPTVTLRYRLPDEQADYDRARLGGEAITALWEIDQHCRSLLKHGEPTPEERRLRRPLHPLVMPSRQRGW